MPVQSQKLIVEFMSVRDAVELLRVCKYWNKNLRHDHIWKHFVIERYIERKSLQVIESICS
jgi:hypothetical protein